MLSPKDAKTKPLEGEDLWKEFFALNPFFGHVKPNGNIKSSTRKQENKLAKKSKKLPQRFFYEKEQAAERIQTAWRDFINKDSKIKVNEGHAALSPQARLLTNVRSKDEIKEILKNAKKSKRFNTDEVRVILQQDTALACIRELFHEKILTKEEAQRFIELQEKAVKDSHVIYKSKNLKKIKDLFILLQNGLTHNPEKPDDFSQLTKLFSDPTFPEVVLGLLDSEFGNKLQVQQLLTLFELYQTQLPRIKKVDGKEVIGDETKITNIYRILDNKGEFTEEAKKYLLENFETGKHLAHGRLNPIIKDNKNFDRFKALVSALPPSEQIFYLASIPKSSRLTTAVFSESVFSSDLAKTQYIVPSCGVRNAIGILRHGVENYVPVIPQFGVKSMSDIETGIRKHHARFGFLYYPKTADPGNVHKSEKDSYLGIFAHDIYHSDVLSSMPDYAKKGLLHFAIVIREKIDIHWSEEIWIWIDADFRYFKANGVFNNDPKMNISHFVSMLDTVQQEFQDDIYGQVLSQNKGLTPLGALLFIDMVINKKSWQDIGLDPDLLPDNSPNRVPYNPRAKTKERQGMDLFRPQDYQGYYKKITNILNLNDTLLKKTPAAQILETFVYLSQNNLSKKMMGDFGDFVDNLLKLNLISLKKGSDNYSKLHFNNQPLEFNITLNNRDSGLATILMMYHSYQQSTTNKKWQKSDFLNAYQNAEKFMGLLQKVNIPELLQKVISILTSSIELTPSTFDSLEKDINAYLKSRPNQVLAFLKGERQSSDALLDKIYEMVLSSKNKKGLDIAQLYNAIIQYDKQLVMDLEKKQKSLSSTSQNTKTPK